MAFIISILSKRSDSGSGSLALRDLLKRFGLTGLLLFSWPRLLSRSTRASYFGKALVKYCNLFNGDSCTYLYNPGDLATRRWPLVSRGSSSHCGRKRDYSSRTPQAAISGNCCEEYWRAPCRAASLVVWTSLCESVA